MFSLPCLELHDCFRQLPVLPFLFLSVCSTYTLLNGCRRESFFTSTLQGGQLLLNGCSSNPTTCQPLYFNRSVVLFRPNDHSLVLNVVGSVLLGSVLLGSAVVSFLWSTDRTMREGCGRFVSFLLPSLGLVLTSCKRLLCGLCGGLLCGRLLCGGLWHGRRTIVFIVLF